MELFKTQQWFLKKARQQRTTGLYQELVELIKNPIQFILRLRYSDLLNTDLVSKFLEFEPELLYKAGILLPEYMPVDFDNITTIGDTKWLPYNEGILINDIRGERMDWDTANKNRILPSQLDWMALGTIKNQVGIYKNTFGRVFQGDDNNLFLPFGISINSSQGRYWSSSVLNSTYGYYCYFDYYGIVNPEGTSLRANSFSVRCVKK